MSKTRSDEKLIEALRKEGYSEEEAEGLTETVRILTKPYLHLERSFTEEYYS